DRYQRVGDLKDLEAALQASQEAVDLTPSEDPEKPEQLHGLAILLAERCQRLGDLKDLEAALQRKQEAADLTPLGHPDRPGQLKSLAISLREQYRILGDLEYLDSAIQRNQEAVGLTPPGHPDKGEYLQSLAISLTERYRRLGDLKDLEGALQADQEALDLTPSGHPQKPERLQSLAASLTDRYRRLGDLKDLEAALQRNQEAVNLTPPGHPDRAEHLQSLAISLTDRYRRLADLKDLEAALKADQEAVDLTPPGHPDRLERLQDLGISLTDRYRRLRDLKDLEAALQTKQEAVGLTPLGHPEKAERLRGLAISLTDRYQRLGDLKDLEAAVQANEEAVKLTLPGHPDRPGQLQDLAISLTHRYWRLGDLTDHEAALQAYQEAVNLTPPGHIDRPDQLRGLAVLLTDRYQRLGDLKDLEAALKANEKAVELTPPGHPEKPERLQDLAISLTVRYRILGLQKDLEAIHLHCSASFELPSAHPETSWRQALQIASFAKEFFPSDCIPAFRAAFNLLPEILWLGLSISSRHDILHGLNIHSATSTATQACIHFSDLVAAVELLEQGLATIFQQMIQLKTDVDALPPDQAEILLNLSLQLYHGQFSEPITIADTRNKLLNDIRRQPGFRNFLLPKSYNVLCQAAKGGPVVILTGHEDQCYALVLLNPTVEPILVSLPTVTLKLLKSQREVLKELLGHCNVRHRGQTSSSRLFGQCEPFLHKPTHECFEEILTWLWVNVVSPIYMILQLHGVTHGRLWWLPTGAFAGLPLHASAPTDEFIHSYITTLGSLLDGYGKKLHGTAPPKLTVIGVTHTGSNKANTLGGVVTEVEKIASIVKEPHIQSLVGEQATVEAVKLQLQDCSWVHFACHGCQDLVDPAKSHLMLYGGTLELETILRMPLTNAQFVFLAACQTAMGDAELVNESFHLGGGFITAGFQSVIATMWAMNDEDGPTVAGNVYSHLFREGRQPQVTESAEALQLAVKELKRRKVPYERWVPFIHMGV
ncbi:CHAT domain-containing protein, partial [Mycena galopus ATCC 62051]